MAKTNKICVTCGKQYHYCNNCAADNNKPSWMGMFCSENCKDLFKTATDYYAGELSQSKAKAIVNKLDTTNKAQLKASIVKMIDELSEISPEVEVIENVKESDVVTESKDINVESPEDTLDNVEAVPTEPTKKNKHIKKNRFIDE